MTTVDLFDAPADFLLTLDVTGGLYDGTHSQ